MKQLQFVGALAILIVGVVIGFLMNHTAVHAQSDPAAGAWEISHGAWGTQSWYAIKHNRITGEVWVLSAQKGIDGDSWLKLPEVVAKTK